MCIVMKRLIEVTWFSSLLSCYPFLSVCTLSSTKHTHTRKWFRSWSQGPVPVVEIETVPQIRSRSSHLLLIGINSSINVETSLRIVNDYLDTISCGLENLVMGMPVVCLLIHNN
jgi:hypothetical protein